MTYRAKAQAIAKAQRKGEGASNSPFSALNSTKQQ